MFFATMFALFDRRSVRRADAGGQFCDVNQLRCDMGQRSFPIRFNKSGRAQPGPLHDRLRLSVFARGENLLAGLADRILVQAGDDAAAARHGALAVLVIVCLAGGALFRGQRLRHGSTGKSDGANEDSGV